MHSSFQVNRAKFIQNMKLIKSYLILFVIGCSVYVAYYWIGEFRMTYKHIWKPTFLTPKTRGYPTFINVNQSASQTNKLKLLNSDKGSYIKNIKDHIPSYHNITAQFVPYNVMLHSTHDIISSPKIDFIPNLKSACFYIKENSR